MVKGYSGSPIVRAPDWLFHSFDHLTGEERDHVAAKLAALPREKLRRSFRDWARAGRRSAVWALGQEYTRRGIPPVFRPSPWLDGKPSIPLEDIFLQDLQWLVAKYPSHKTPFKKWQELFKPGQFARIAGFMVTGSGLKEPAFYLRGLGLDADQQTELLYIKSAPLRNKKAYLDSISENVRDFLRVRHNLRAKARARADKDQTIERRHRVWMCGSLANWMPQRTADLYKAMTGETISRQTAKNIIDEVGRDYPESKPGPVRRRRRSTTR